MYLTVSSPTITRCINEGTGGTRTAAVRMRMLTVACGDEGEMFHKPFGLHLLDMKAKGEVNHASRNFFEKTWRTYYPP